ncbi:MAG: hypothetical protein ACK5IJ_10010 [Mangrovibacterium sp.]
MKKLHLNILLATLMSALAFASCEVEPDFPLPGFTEGNREVTFRRDTVPTSYDITFGMSLNNAVASIELIDGYDSEHITWIEDYNGMKSFSLTYTQDLTNIDTYNDTALYRKFRIVDTAGGAYNRMCKMNIKKLSRPEVVGLTDGKTIAIQGEIYKPSGKAATGMIALKSVEYLFGEESLYQKSFTDTVLYEYTLNKGVSLLDFNIEEGELYPFSVVVTDANDRSVATTINLSLVPAKMPTKIIWDNGNKYPHEIKMTLDEQERISVITVSYASALTGAFTDYDYILTYNDLGQVVSFNQDASTTYTNSFSYDAEGNLSSAFYYKSSREIKDFMYNDKELLTSCYHYNKIITFPYYTDPLELDFPLFSVHWGDRGPYYQTKMSQITEFHSLFMPTFIEELPPFFDMGAVRTEPIFTLFTNRLLPAKIEVPNSDIYGGTGTSSSTGTVTYDENENGTIHKITMNYASGSLKGIHTYTFVYE